MKSLLNNLHSFTGRRAARLIVVFVLSLMLMALVTFTLRIVSADTLGKFGITKQSRAGKLLKQIAPKAFNSTVAPAAPFAVYTVNSLDDTNTGSGTSGTLRYCITQTNALGGADTINFSVNGMITLTSNLPNITDSLTINGNGMANTIISGNNLYRSLNSIQTDGLTVTIQNLKATNGFVAGSGFGGALDFDSTGGTLTVNNVELTNGSAGYGGGLNADDGTLNISNCVFTMNTSNTSGGALWLGGTVTTTFVNCLISGNQGPAGALHSNGGTVTIHNSTIAGNNSTSTGAVRNNGSSSILNLRNSILANNTGGDGDCSNGLGTVNAQHTLIETGTCGITNGVNGNLTSDPALNPDYTLTSTSNAVGTGNNALIPVGVTTDLAGNARIQQGAVDIGAYESPFPGIVPALGNYPATTVNLGAQTTVTPDAAPTDATNLVVKASSGFNGTFYANPATGVIQVINAHPAGTYTVIVTSFRPAGSASKTFTLTVQSGSACATPLFSSAPNLSVGSAYSPAVGDFNNDGKQDLAIANNSSASVSIRLGDGASGFTGTTTVSTGSLPFAIAVGDFNGDGNQDLAVACTIGSVSIRLGDGAGNFSGTTNVSAGSTSKSIALGDFNGDGKLDFVTANFGVDTASVRFGNGAGAFSGSTNVSVGDGPGQVRLGDFDGDGDLDFATSNQNAGTVSVRLNDGAGNFSGTTEITVGANPEFITQGDFNNDGKLDFVTANQNAALLSVRFGDGAGSFTGTTTLTVTADPRQVLASDFNNDGNPDIVVKHGTAQTVSYLLGDGLGGFGSPVSIATTGLSGSFLALGDFNGDGRQDFVTTGFSANLLGVRLGGCNTPPTITAGGPLARQAGSAGSGSTIAVVSDTETAAGSLTVTATTLPTGITVTGITNTSGTVTATVTAACNATVGANTVVLTVTDGNGATATANLAVNVTAAAAPTASNAGPDQTLCATAPATLAANTPTVGTGGWSIVSGLSLSTAQFSSLTNPAATFTPAGGIGTYTLRWTITGACATSSDDVVLTYNAVPTITLGASPTVFPSATSANLPYSATTGSPNQYSIDYDAAANAAGFVDVTNAALTASPIVLTVPGAAASATYNAMLTVRNSATGCVGSSVAFTVTISSCPSSFTVSNPGDAVDATPGNGVCATAGGVCTLRAAIQEANALTACSPITITITTTGTITLGTALPALNHPNLTINGPGANLLTVSANGVDRVFQTSGSTTATLNGLTITGGNTSGAGGGIFTTGSSTLTVMNCTVTGNTSGNIGGGIANSVGCTLNVINSTVSNNTSNAPGASGGGIDSPGTLTVTNSTITGNTKNNGSNNGGGIYTNGNATITNSTITNNTTVGANGAGGLRSSGVVTVRNSIIAANTSNTTVPDVFGSFATTGGGFNLIGNVGTATGFNQAGDQTGTGASPLNPLLASLGSYGGPTSTHALLPGSPAINAGTATGAPSSDQRGIARVGNVDIGAFESRGFTLAVAGGNNQSAVTSTAFASPLSLTVTSANSEPVNGGRVTFTPPGSGASCTLTTNPATITGGAASSTATANTIIGGPYTVFAAASGATSVNFSLTNANTAPTITAGGPLSRQAGGAGSSATIATVSDTETAAGSLTVTATTVPTGISVTGITNTSGTVTATVTAACNATVGANTVVLTVTDGNGATNTANLTVNVTAATAPTTSNAGPDQTLCATAPATLAANLPSVGTGAWSIVNGPSTLTSQFSSLTNRTATFTPAGGTGVYTLRWTITGACATSTDDVVLTYNANPTAATAGPDQTVCATSATLAANTPTVGTGAWSIVSGAGGTVTTLSSPTSGFTGVAGTSYTLRWTISNSPCTASTDDVVITLAANPTTAAAGTDQSFCGTSAATLAANAPSVGAGAWTVVTGPSTLASQFSNVSSPTATFTPAGGTGTYTLRWTISNSPCTSSTDEVVITYNAVPTITLGASPSVLPGATSANLPYSATTGSPNQYSIDYNAAANTAGFVDVTNASLTASPIVLVVPGAAASATYNATLTVRNSTTGCVSSGVAFTVTISACVTSLAVNNTGDGADATPGNGLCETATGNGICTLRAAIQEANALTSCSPFTINFSVAGTINLGSVLPDLNHPNLTINNGADPTLLTVRRDTGGNYRIFTIASGRTVTINGLTMRDGDVGASGSGGGIYNSNGTLTLNDCVVSNNIAGDTGAGIAQAFGTTIINRSAIADNTLVTGTAGIVAGAGLYANQGTVILNGDTFSGNSKNDAFPSSIQGAAMLIDGATVTATNCTFSGNTGRQTILNFANSSPGTLTLLNCTVTNNTLNSTGSPFAAVDTVGLGATATTIVRNTVVAGNTGNGTAFRTVAPATLTSQGNNLCGDTTLTPTAGGDLTNANPLLAALGNYGGLTQTHALLPGSPAINAGTATGAPTTDQRGIARAGNVDIGAFESRGFTLAVSGGNNQSTPVSTAFALPLSVTVTSADSEPVNGGQVLFTPPGSGAGCTLATNPATIFGGTASSMATANAIVGGPYTVTAMANGATPAINFSLTNLNTAPAFTPAAAISRQQGSAAGASVTIGLVADAQTAAGSLTVTQIAGGTA
ncbi:MAG TPA: choice-of-anchor Q domain-containing protein, partial [Blastocatellia bacterium]